jgi:hypothetical protein
VNPIKRKQMEDQLNELEAEIGRGEAAIAHCETALQTFVSVEETTRLTQQLEKERAELKSHLETWEELSEALQT